MTTSWKAIIGVILIYLFGCFSGVVGTAIVARHKVLDFMKHPGITASAAMEKRLTGNLNLDANQKQQVHQFFMENLEQRKALQKQIQPQIQMLNRQTFQEISGVLNLDQLDRFHQNLAEFRKHAGANILNPDPESQPPISGAPTNSPPH